MEKQPGEIVLGIVGEQIQVGIHETVDGMEVSASPTNMIDDITRQAARELGIPLSRQISDLGFVIGEAVLGKLAASDGFSIKFGDVSHPRERVDVILRKPEAKTRKAKVRRN